MQNNHLTFCSLFGLTGSAAACAVLSLTLIVDPYGVFGLTSGLTGVNKFKPVRINIDRQIKPLEVLLKRPKTIFLGTSRIHQSIDPNHIRDTDLWPAYNAAIPASELGENRASVALYTRYNTALKHVVMEAFIYNALRPVQHFDDLTIGNVLNDAFALGFSLTALWASIETLLYNQRNDHIATAYIDELGAWRRQPGLPTSFSEQDYIQAITKAHKTIPDMIVQPSALNEIRDTANLVSSKGISFTLIITPNYPWDDYRLFALGYWPRIEEYFTALAAIDNVAVYSSTGYVDATLESPAPIMQFWYDPIHFNSRYGGLILDALIATKSMGRGNALSERVTASNARSLVEMRLRSLLTWIDRNRAFAEAFNSAMYEAGIAPSQTGKAVHPEFDRRFPAAILNGVNEGVSQ
jgi:hypothetical protein